MHSAMGSRRRVEYTRFKHGSVLLPKPPPPRPIDDHAVHVAPATSKRRKSCKRGVSLAFPGHMELHTVEDVARLADEARHQRLLGLQVELARSRQRCEMCQLITLGAGALLPDAARPSV